MKTTTGRSDRPAFLADPLQHLESGHVRQPEIEHDAVTGLLGEGGQRRGTAVGGHDIQIVVTQQFLDAQLLRRIILDDEQPLAPCAAYALRREIAAVSPLLSRGLGDEPQGARVPTRVGDPRRGSRSERGYGGSRDPV